MQSPDEESEGPFTQKEQAEQMQVMKKIKESAGPQFTPQSLS